MTTNPIAQLLRVQEREARLMGLDAPPRRAVDLITHDAFMQAIEELEADIARKEAELAGCDARGADIEAADLAVRDKHEITTVDAR